MRQYLILFIIYSLRYVTCIRDLCHPQCYVKCLPSCTCCNANENPTSSFDTFKRNENRLKNLGRLLMERDLIVGFSCDPYCEKRCVPSCKFSCCGRNEKSAVNENLSISTAGKSKEEFSLKKLVKAIEDTQSEYLKLKAFISKVNATIQREENLPEAVVFNTEIKMPELIGNTEKELNDNEFHIKNGKMQNSVSPFNNDIKTEPEPEKINAAEFDSLSAHLEDTEKNKNTEKDDKSANKVYQTIQTLQEKIDEEVKRRKLKKRKKEKKKILKDKNHRYLVTKLKALIDAKDKLKKEFLKNSNYEKIPSLQKIDDELAKAANAYELIKLYDTKTDNTKTKANRTESKTIHGKLLSGKQQNLEKVLENVEAGRNSVILEVIDQTGSQLSEIRVKKKSKKKYKKRKQNRKSKKFKSKKKRKKLLKSRPVCTEDTCQENNKAPCCDLYTQSTNLPGPLNAQSYQKNYLSTYQPNYSPLTPNSTSQISTPLNDPTNLSNFYGNQASPYTYYVNSTIPNQEPATVNNANIYKKLTEKENQQPWTNTFSIMQSNQTTGRRTDTPDDTKHQIQTLISLLQNTVKEIDEKQTNDTATLQACKDDCKKQCLPDCHFMCC